MQRAVLAPRARTLLPASRSVLRRLLATAGHDAGVGERQDAGRHWDERVAAAFVVGVLFLALFA